MKREPSAATKTRLVRVMTNILTKQGFFVLSFDCVNVRIQINRAFAQGSPINVENHGVVSGQ